MDQRSSEHAPEAVSHSRADILYDAVCTGAIGGSLVALFFLMIDAWNGQPLFTPSLLGSVLFERAAAASVSHARLDMVAYYSVVHFAAFGALGAAVSIAVHEAELHARHPALVLLGLFAVFEIGFAVAATLLLPGVIARLGVVPVASANALAAVGVGVFLLAEHRPDVWLRVKRVAHLA